MKWTKRKLAATTVLIIALATLVTTLATSARKSRAADHALARTDQASDHAEAEAKVMTVQTTLPERKDLVVKFEQPSSVAPFTEAELYASVSGYVQKMHVDIGDSVNASQVLLDIDVPELNQELAYKQALVLQAEADDDQAKAGVLAAQAALEALAGDIEQAEADVKKMEAECKFRNQQAERYSRLASNSATTQELADEKTEQLNAALAACESSRAKLKAVQGQRVVLAAKLETAKADERTKIARVAVTRADSERTRVTLEFAQVRAPFDGIITRRNVDEGAYVHSPSSDRSTAIFTLARTDVVTVVMQVPEREVLRVQLGCRASMRLSALDGAGVEGHVARFSHALDEQSRTMRVEIDIDNPTGRLYPGMYGNVALVIEDLKQALTVPASAIYSIQGEPHIILIERGTARQVPVQTGYDDGVVVQILKGLRGDEEIVLSNKGEIAEGQPLRAARIAASQVAGGKPAEGSRTPAHAAAN